MLLSLLGTGSALAVGAHVGAQFYEPPLVLSLRLHAVAIVALTALLARQEGMPFWKALLGCIALSIAYLVTLAFSLVTYRLYLHRLRALPGEAIHKLTMFSWLPIDWNGTRPTHLQTLHAKYGPVIRTGPREVSVADPRAVAAIYSAGGKVWQRGPWYLGQARLPGWSERPSVATSTTQHDGRRKAWEAALTANTLQGRQGVQHACSEQLVQRLSRLAGEAPVDLAECLAYYALDTWALLVLGQSLDLLECTEMPEMVAALDERLRMLNTVSRVPYCIEAVLLLPSSTRAFETWVAESVEQRERLVKDAPPAAIDIARRESKGEHKGEAVIEAMLLVLHGSDTTRSILTWCVAELASQPALAARLRDEIDSTFGRKAVDDDDRLQDACPFLSACLRETLRLWPPVPSGLLRITPSHGLSLPDSKVRLPPNIAVSMPTYTMHRDPANFSSPNNFQPTRWLPAEHTASAHNEAAFLPFGRDTTSCMASAVVLAQCRLVLARLVQSFDLSMTAESVEEVRRSYRDQHTVARTLCLVHLQAR